MGVPALPICTVMAVFSANTTFNIILNGFVSVVILQMDSQVFFALYTEAQCHDMRDNYRLVLGREEEHVLRREIRAVTLSSWIYMVMMYLVLQQGSLYVTAAHSEIPVEFQIVIEIFPIAGFT